MFGTNTFFYVFLSIKTGILHKNLIILPNFLKITFVCKVTHVLCNIQRMSNKIKINYKKHFEISQHFFNFTFVFCRIYLLFKWSFYIINM